MGECLRDYGKCGMRIEYELDDQTMEVISDNIGQRGAHCFGYYCNACDWKSRCNPTPPYVLLDDVRCCCDGMSLRFDIVRHLNFLFDGLESYDGSSGYSAFRMDCEYLSVKIYFLFSLGLISDSVCDRFFKILDDLRERGLKNVSTR